MTIHPPATRPRGLARAALVALTVSAMSGIGIGEAAAQHPAAGHRVSIGGDRLFFAQALYVIPITKVQLPLVGSPFVAARFAIGAAGVGHFGVPTHNVGVRVGIGPVEVDYMQDPRTNERQIGVGLSRIF